MILLTVTLTVALLILAWLLGQLPVFWKRMIVVFALSWLGYGAVWLADSRDVSEVVRAGTAIALVVAGIACALFLIQPLKWGLDDFFAARDASAAEVQP